jgi:hypothetical protein
MRLQARCTFAKEYQMNRKKCLGAALLLSLALASTAQAQQTPSSTWNDSLTWRGPIDRSVDIQRAEAQKRARSGGYGPAEVNTTYEGDVTFNSANEYNGNVSNNTATTATNLNSFQSTVRQDGSNSATITFTTGSTAHNTSQNATATSANSESGPASTSNTSTNGQ